jgi:hypothetical protein
MARQEIRRIKGEPPRPGGCGCKPIDWVQIIMPDRTGWSRSAGWSRKQNGSDALELVANPSTFVTTTA